MTEANQPPLVMIAGIANILGGLLNILVGFFYLFVCYGIFVMPIGLWQVVAGAMMISGKRVPGGFFSAVAGVIGSVITFNIMGLLCSGAAAGLAGYEEFGTEPPEAKAD